MPFPDDVGAFPAGGTWATLEGTVVAEAPSGSATRHVVVDAARLVDAQADRPVRGKVRVTLRGEARPLEGRRVRVEGRLSRPGSTRNPGEFDLAERLTRAHVRAVQQATACTILPSPARGPRYWAAQVRGALLRRLERLLPPPAQRHYAALLGGIVFGAEVTPVPRSIALAFRRTGTIHLLVVSGAQITLLAWLVMAVSGPRGSPEAMHAWLAVAPRSSEPRRVIPRTHWWQAVPAVLLLVFFALMVGAGPSVGRALAMFAVALISRLGHLDYDPYTALGLAAAAICAFDPLAVASVSVQLSFAATLGVIVGLRAVRAAARRVGWTAPALGGGAAALGSWLMTTPLLAHHFGAAPLVGSLANLVAVPLCGILLAVTVVALPLSYVWIRLGALLLYGAPRLLDLVVLINEWCGSLPFAYVSSVRFGAGSAVAWYGVLVLVGCAYRARNHWRDALTPRRAAAGLLGAGVLASLWFAVSAARPGRLDVAFLSVGHGQCCVVRLPDGGTLIVDAGSGQTLEAGERCARETIIPYLVHQGIRRIDFLVITHPDADHCNAAPSLLAAFPVGRILESFRPAESEVYAELVEAAQREGVPMQPTWAGAAIELGPEARAEVLWPTGTASDTTFSDNDRSVVLRVVHDEVAMLLPGDISITAERELLRRKAALQAEVLQVPHHGSAGSSCWDFLRSVRPQVAVASCGGSEAAFPHPVVFNRLRELHAEVWRTDLAGAVMLESDGRSVRVRGHAGDGVQKWSRRAAPPTRANASMIASGSVSATAAASGGSLLRTAPITRRAISARTSGASSQRRSLNRWRAASSSGVSAAPAGRTSAARSSTGWAACAGASAAAGKAVSRSFTTTVPAARSPRRLLSFCAKATTAPRK
jgi:competence protein ComEC